MNHPGKYILCLPKNLILIWRLRQCFASGYKLVWSSVVQLQARGPHATRRQNFKGHLDFSLLINKMNYKNEQH